MGISVIKAFGVDGTFDFHTLKTYQLNCDYFLFDAKTKYHGGSGRKFNWNVLSLSDYGKPVFISGGISSEDAESLAVLQKMNIYAIDINSRFETAPAMKDPGKVKNFIEQIRRQPVQ
jgi:phosphoribosylanthranilate isomerase